MPRLRGVAHGLLGPVLPNSFGVLGGVGAESREQQWGGAPNGWATCGDVVAIIRLGVLGVTAGGSGQTHPESVDGGSEKARGTSSLPGLPLEGAREPDAGSSKLPWEHLCARLEARGDRLGALLAATAAAARDAALTPVSGTLEVALPAVADPTVPIDVSTGKHLGRHGVEASHTEAP